MPFDPVHDALASNDKDTLIVKNEIAPSNLNALLTNDNSKPTETDIKPQISIHDDNVDTETEQELDQELEHDQEINNDNDNDNETQPESEAIDTPIPEELSEISNKIKLQQSTQTQDQDQNGAQLGDHITITTPGKPTILKHKLNNLSKFGSKRQKKNAPLSTPTDRGSFIISSRSRHLKKEDGQPFWRKDIQYEFLTSLFDNNIKAFTDPFPESEDQVNIDSRKPDSNGKLSFAELYIKTIAQSPKCSKVLKDRLLNDMKMSIPTSMICLLVNVGRMNTTINFVPDMKSQLRTYHSIPSLQVNYDTGSTIDKNDKQLQDTPRLKSILKAVCDDPSEPNGLHSLAQATKIPKTNVINMIFILGVIEETINKTFFETTEYTFFDIFMNPKYRPDDRSNLFLWVLYNYLETSLDEEGISSNPFGSQPVLKECDFDEFDVDTPEELEFGKSLYEQRLKFLASDEPSLKKASTPSKSKSASKSPSIHENPHDSITSNIEDDSTEFGSKIEKKEKEISNLNLKKTPQKKTSIKKEDSTPLTGVSNTQNQLAFTPPPPPLRQDIDVEKIRRSLSTLRKRYGKKRAKKGLLSHEYALIIKENYPEEVKEGNNRARLKTYKGDYGEYTTKFRTLFNMLKTDYVELTKDALNSVNPSVSIEYEDKDESLDLKSFKLDI